MKYWILVFAIVLAGTKAEAQQFNDDNQWTAPHGVATLVGTVGEDYSAFVAVAALMPDWEFNVGGIHFYDDPEGGSGSYTSSTLYVKHRLSQNEAETAGYAPPSYRIGLRWEGKKLITALTFSDAFNGSSGAGLEFGFMYLTEPRLCWGGCRGR